MQGCRYSAEKSMSSIFRLALVPTPTLPLPLQAPYRSHCSLPPAAPPPPLPSTPKTSCPLFRPPSSLQTRCSLALLPSPLQTPPPPPSTLETPYPLPCPASLLQTSSNYFAFLPKHSCPHSSPRVRLPAQTPFAFEELLLHFFPWRSPRALVPIRAERFPYR